MSMVTSCPSCVTTFRVSHEQLNARHGEVRCGKCYAVFDAFKTLASLPDEPLPESLPEPQPEPLAPPVTQAYPASDGTGSMPAQTTLDIDPAPAANLKANQKFMDGLANLTAMQTFMDALKFRAERARPEWHMGAAVLVLSVGFLLQLAYAMRTPLTSTAPALIPVFERVCLFTGCTLTLPRRTEALAIESSDLQADPARAGVIVLTAVLRNRSSAPVEHPALELTLTNPQDQAIARRVFLPRDYVEPAVDISRGMGALAEVNVHLELDTGELRAAGYRLFLFYP